MVPQSIAVLLLLVVSASANFVIKQNYDTVVVSKGDNVNLICSSDMDFKFCSFSNPYNKYALNFDEGVVYDRLKYHGTDKKDCGVSISSVDDVDNGEWICTITTADLSSNIGKFNVTVATAPENVFLRVNDDIVQDDINVVLNDTVDEKMEIDCVATQARPQPSFKWFIGDTFIHSETADSQENFNDNGKADYVQTLMYYSNAKHNGQNLRCEVTHQGYTEAQKENNENVAEESLKLFFKPMQKAKTTKFYNLKENQSNDIVIVFEASPKPTSGFWVMKTENISLGALSADGVYNASQLKETNVIGEYSASLSINPLTKDMSGMLHELIVTNDQGTTSYNFTLELGDVPLVGGHSETVDKVDNTEPLNFGPVIGIIAIVIIIAIIVGFIVFARSKGIFCFSSKNGEQLTDEKETAAFDNAEKGEPLNPEHDMKDKSHSAANLETTKTENDEKRNGDQTPV